MLPHAHARESVRVEELTGDVYSCPRCASKTYYMRSVYRHLKSVHHLREGEELDALVASVQRSACKVRARSRDNSTVSTTSTATTSGPETSDESDTPSGSQVHPCKHPKRRQSPLVAPAGRATAVGHNELAQTFNLRPASPKSEASDEPPFGLFFSHHFHTLLI